MKQQKSRANMLRVASLIIVFVITFLLHRIYAATLPGAARVEIADTTGGLSWSPTANALTVACWFKLSIPSTVTFTSGQKLVVLADRRTGAETDNHSYLIQLDVTTGNVEFSAKGATDSIKSTLIEKPFLERWYYVAVVRNGTEFIGYVDGLEVFRTIKDIGNSANTDGVSIGGWGTTKYLYGEVQEVRIFQSALGQELLAYDMFEDLDPTQYPSLAGYYKLAYSTNTADNLKNFAATPPTGTNPAVAAGTGALGFVEVNEKGEQSLFDAKKNKGADAIIPLSGAFTWEHEVFSRPTVGVPFAFEIAYGSSTDYNSNRLGSYNPFDQPPLGPGWRHTFEARILPAQYFDPQYSGAVGLMLWNGDLEVWDVDPETWEYVPRHGEYRGELQPLGNLYPYSYYEWTTPDRTVYKFTSPFGYGSSLLRGQLVEIRDLNGNKTTITRYQSGSLIGKVSKVTDSGGGVYTFNYDAQGRLTDVTFGQWKALFSYTDGRLTGHSLTGPAAYPTPGTSWQFSYTTDTHLLSQIKDPRSNNMAAVTYDSFGRVVSEKDALNRETKTEYNKPGDRQVTVTDARLKTWVTTYDRLHRVVSRKNPLNLETKFEYDTHGNLTKETDPKNRVTIHEYDDRANVTRTVDRKGQETSAAYSYLNRPLQETNQAGWVTHYAYDFNEDTKSGKGNLLRIYDDLGTRSEFAYTLRGQVYTGKDANGNTTSFTYTPEGFLQAKTVPGSYAWNYTYNEQGWPLTETDPLSRQFTLAYDINGKVLSKQGPLTTYHYEYDANGNRTKASDGKGIFTAFTYDSANQMTGMTTRDGKVWQYAYSPTGKPSTVTDPLFDVTTSMYDDADRLVSVADPAPFTTTTRLDYDENSNVIRKTDRAGQVWTTEFDELDRPVTATDPLGHRSSTTYYPAGWINQTTSPNGFSQKHSYDGRGRLAKWVDEGNYEWSYGYDGNGNVIAVTDPLGGVYAMEYGSRNERTKEINQDLFEWSYTYDPLLRLQTDTDPNHRTKTYTYDAGGRINTVTYNTGRTDSYTHDLNDNLTAISRANSGQTLATGLVYDAMDRIKECTDPFLKTVKYGYDDLGRLQQLTYPDNKAVTYQYDSLNRMTGHSDWDGRTIGYEYDAAGRMTGESYPSACGIKKTVAYDTAGRATRIEFRKPAGGALLLGFDYTYDANGNLLHTEETGVPVWTPPRREDRLANYTPAGRLTTASDAETAAGQNDFSYSYDSAGNLTGASSPANNYALGYDENNRTTGISWNRTGGSIRTVANGFDGLGRRISRTTDGTETRFVLDVAGSMERVLADTDNTGAIGAYYIHGADLVYCVDGAGNATYFLGDRLSNVRALAGSTGTIQRNYQYTPEGRELIATTGDTNPYTFVGTQGVMEDLPGMYFMRARYYSADAGVFLATDPVKNIGPKWRSVAYAYVGGNPINFTDPVGLYAFQIGLEGSFGASAIVGSQISGEFGLVVETSAFMKGDFGNAFGFYLTKELELSAGTEAGVGPGGQVKFSGSNSGYGVQSIQGISQSVSFNLEAAAFRGSYSGDHSWSFGIGPKVEMGADVAFGMSTTQVSSFGAKWNPSSSFVLPPTPQQVLSGNGNGSAYSLSGGSSSSARVAPVKAVEETQTVTQSQLNELTGMLNRGLSSSSGGGGGGGGGGSSSNASYIQRGSMRDYSTVSIRNMFPQSSYSNKSTSKKK